VGIRGFKICIPATCPTPHSFAKSRPIPAIFNLKTGFHEAGWGRFGRVLPTPKKEICWCNGDPSRLGRVASRLTMTMEVLAGQDVWRAVEEAR
jgi:hypothetical protein